MKKLLIPLGILLVGLCLLCGCGGEHAAHHLTAFSAVSPTCGSAGTAAYWQCAECGRRFADAACKQEITEDAQLAVAATGQHCYDGGNACTVCGLELVEHSAAPYRLNEDGASYTFLGTAAAAEVTVPAQYEGKPVTAVAPSAFAQNKTLKSVVLPDTVTTVSENAFLNCTALTDVTLGCGLAAVGNAAFSGCSALVRVSVPSVEAWLGIAFDGVAANPFCYATEFYVGGVKTTEITVPAGVTEILDYAFYNFRSLRKVTLPEGLVRIGDSAFYACSYLEECRIPTTLTVIGKEAFYFCRSLKQLTLPVGLTEIGSSAFARCTALTAVEMGATAGWRCCGVTLHAADLAVPTTAAVYLTTLHTEETWRRTGF
ncbi:MAG: leucine-rich repeat domain-containing protein [Clostridia bacterium]|nr:leucine-rich repeat domain-containing protein [Clostridia bacterium]